MTTKPIELYKLTIHDLDDKVKSNAFVVMLEGLEPRLKLQLLMAKYFHNQKGNGARLGDFLAGNIAAGFDKNIRSELKSALKDRSLEDRVAAIEEVYKGRREPTPDEMKDWGQIFSFLFLVHETKKAFLKAFVSMEVTKFAVLTAPIVIPPPEPEPTVILEAPTKAEIADFNKKTVAAVLMEYVEEVGLKVGSKLKMTELLKVFDIPNRDVWRTWVEAKKVHQHKHICKIDEVLGARILDRKAFFRKAGFYTDIDHLMEVAKAKKYSFDKLLDELVRHRDLKDHKDFAAAIGINYRSVRQWFDDGKLCVPEEKTLHELITFFGIEKREHKELFFEKAGKFYDEKHVIKIYMEGAMPLIGEDGFIHHMMQTIGGGSITKYMEDRKLDTGATRHRWVSLGKIPRDKFIDLTDKADPAQRKKILGDMGFYLGMEDIFAAFKESKDLPKWLDAVKETYGLTDAMMDVSNTTLIDFRDGDAANISTLSLAKIFTSLAAKVKVLDNHWDDLKP